MADDVWVDLDESRPRRARIPRGTTDVWVKNPQERPVDREALCAAIESQKTRLAVTGLILGYDSSMTSPWIVRVFPNLEYVSLLGKHLLCLDDLLSLQRLKRVSVDIERPTRRSLAALTMWRGDDLTVLIAKAEDEETIAACTYLKSLWLTGWRKKDLASLHRLRLESLGVQHGAIEVVQGINCERLRKLYAAYCTKLVAMGRLRAEEVEVDACKHLDLGSLAAVEGIRKLTLRGPRETSSFGFLRGCPELEELVITVGRVTATDFSPLIEAGKLRKVWFSRIPDASVAAIGRANPRLIIANCRVCFVNGEPRRPEEFHVG